MAKKNNSIVTFGLKNVKYALATITDGVVTYGEVKNLKGAQELEVPSQQIPSLLQK